MSPLRIISLTAALGLPATAMAEPPRVVADILPVHSLVAQVMHGVAAPDLLLPAGADPHAYAMKPSTARALSQANLVFWVGPELLPWMADTLPQLAPSAQTAALLHAPGSTVLDNRADALFTSHEDHDDHAAEDAHQEHEDHAHEHGAEDPHAWLDPENGRAWLSAIAEELSAIDPENADTYRANAETARAKLTTLQAQISAEMPAKEDTGIFVFHDAYQYFENRFELEIAGAISASDAVAPGAARIETVHHAADAFKTICILAKPQFSERLVNTVTDGQAMVQIIDPLGSHIPAGPDHYTTLLSGISASISACGT